MAEIQERAARQIVEAVRDVCGKNINFISPEGIITASTDKEREGTFHEIGKKAAAGGEVIEVEEDEGYFGTQAGVNIPILYHGEVAGVIGISGKPAEVRKYAYLAQRIAVLLMRERELGAQVNSRRERLNFMIRSFAGQGAVSREYFQDFLKEYKLKPEQRFCTVLVRPCAPGQEIRKLERELYRIFERTGSCLYTFFYPDEYVLLIREEDSAFGRCTLETFGYEYSSSLKIGMGMADTLPGQYRSYRAAKQALKSLKRGGFAYYEELGLELILGDVTESVRTMFLEKTAGMLTPEDVGLLRVYFEEECSLLRASRRLNIHRNTLQYRLDRIYGVCGYNPRTFRDGAVLYMGILLAEADGRT